ncbi:MAG: DUF1579 family protein [bacterium]
MKKLIMMFMACVMLMPMTLMAQDEMPPMGAPVEMKALAFLVGDWDAEMEWLMDTTQGWVKSTGTCTYSYILDSAAMKMDFKSEFMGMPFTGLAIETYDRESKVWQSTWIDNMGARTTIMTGTRGNNGSLFEGKELYQGKESHMRMFTSNETETSFDWKMEQSMDGGKTWMESGRAKYTKKK